MQIKKAQRQAVKIKLAVTGPSGSGKTMGSLLLAKGLCPNGKILVIDSEDGSSNLYADHKITKGIDYDVLEIDAPYHTKKFIQALQLGQQEGYDVIIIDSMSTAWKGEGGILDRKTSLDARGGNSFANWGKLTPEQDKFISAIVHAECHVIATMRSKTEYVLSLNEKGKQAPQKVGLSPIQRDGMEYEFSTVFDVAMNHEFSVSKDRTGLFDDRFETLSVETGKEIAAWLAGGAPLEKKHHEKTLEGYGAGETLDTTQSNDANDFDSGDFDVEEAKKIKREQEEKNKKLCEGHMNFIMQLKMSDDENSAIEAKKYCSALDLNTKHILWNLFDDDLKAWIKGA